MYLSRGSSLREANWYVNHEYACDNKACEKLSKADKQNYE